tara:strand:+ start:311150 stop:313168 length:2019 start_codon:yes stop_codon:yes gene_type:complete
MKFSRYRMNYLSLLPWLFLPVASVHGADASLPKFLNRYCADCHNSDTMEGQVSLGTLIENPSEVDASLIQAVVDVVSLGEMPPEDSEQPSTKERKMFLASAEPILQNATLMLMEKATLPGYGNLIPHELLFTEPEVRRAATPARLWRISPHLFMQRANAVTRTSFLVPKANQGGNGLHPAFAYMTPPHSFCDDAAQHQFEQSTTELLFDVAWEISGRQVAGTRVANPVKDFLVRENPKASDWRSMINWQTQLVLRRPARSEEIAKLMSLVEMTRMETDNRVALQTLFAAILMKPEAVYRYEIGDGVPDEHGRVSLTPEELKHSIAYALTDLPPDAELERAAKLGRLSDRSDVRREVQRMLDDFETVSPRLLRFFQEYFEYTGAPEVFKDHRRANAIFATQRVDSADQLVTFVLQQDEQVLARLLTEDRVFIPNASEMREPVERRFRANLHGDFGFPADWQWDSQQPARPLLGERSGILTHPAWLLAFSDNEKNQAIQRGMWVRTKLLGDIVPDTPIGVDAKLPTDPHLTLREKMKQVTTATYCWTCHQKMDPLGLPLEQFDEFGAYRETELNRPVDTTGEIKVGVPEIDGPVSDPFEMLERLAHSQHVEQVFVRHVFRYFLGRNETVDDAPTLIDAHRAYRQSNGSMRSLVLSLLTSDSFVYRRLPSNIAAN